jgi:hypothetical protein
MKASRKHLTHLMTELRASSGGDKAKVGVAAGRLNKARRAIVDRIRGGEEPLPDPAEPAKLEAHIAGLLRELTALVG